MGLQARRGLDHARFVLADQRVGHARIEGVEQAVRGPPFDLCRGAAERVAETRRGQPVRCLGRDLEVEEDAARRVGGKRGLVAIGQRHRCGGRGIAVHRGGGAEGGVFPAVLEGGELAGVGQRTGADGDNGVGVAGLLLHHGDGGFVAVGVAGQHQLLDCAEALEVLGDAAAHGLMGVDVGDHRDAPAEVQGGQHIGLAAVEVFLDADHLEGDGGLLAGFGILPVAGDDVADQFIPVGHLGALREKSTSFWFQSESFGQSSE